MLSIFIEYQEILEKNICFGERKVGWGIIENSIILSRLGADLSNLGSCC
jgi:hypothetical protein